MGPFLVSPQLSILNVEPSTVGGPGVQASWYNVPLPSSSAHHGAKTSPLPLQQRQWRQIIEITRGSKARLSGVGRGNTGSHSTP